MTIELDATRRALMIGAAQAVVTLVLSRPSWAAEALPKMTVTRDPNCGCCGGWITHVKSAGFPVEVVEAPDLAPLKARLGVPETLISCHTAEVDGYVVEGHVPADAVERLLIERPQATGLAVAGMPVGSPGMEVRGVPPETYEVVLFAPGGQRIFARYRGPQAV
ncbi:Uncharacterized conserved protein [Roseomonas rosea]|uniref:Uncharacterized conserved protein n=1 Tax=Muricoccus roseus TaxID=198092 RepID=A0A1M6QPV9_9PROT|nr:DUF411 domain-containing protein [Roseomonas rosea]SHK22123.1 Uncharacterized conserved protein [Roseomonas rosea]